MARSNGHKKRDLSADLADLPGNYLVCRDLRHAWKPGPVFIEDEKRGRIRIVTREATCERCSTIRLDRYAYPSFERLGARYFYPTDYQLREHGRVDPIQVRRETLGTIEPIRREEVA